MPHLWHRIWIQPVSCMQGRSYARQKIRKAMAFCMRHSMLCSLPGGSLFFPQSRSTRSSSLTLTILLSEPGCGLTVLALVRRQTFRRCDCTHRRTLCTIQVPHGACRSRIALPTGRCRCHSCLEQKISARMQTLRLCSMLHFKQSDTA